MAAAADPWPTATTIDTSSGREEAVIAGVATLDDAAPFVTKREQDWRTLMTDMVVVGIDDSDGARVALLGRRSRLSLPVVA